MFQVTRLTSLTEFNYTLDTSTLDGGVVEIVTDSVGVTNPRPTSGKRNRKY